MTVAISLRTNSTMPHDAPQQPQRNQAEPHEAVFKELQSVLNGFDRIKSSNIPIVETFMVHGSPGAKMVHFKQSLDSELKARHATPVRLKLDRMMSSSPYSIIADAFAQLTRRVPKDSRIRDRLQDEIQEGGRAILFNLAPQLRELFDEDNHHRNEPSHQDHGNNKVPTPNPKSVHRFQVLCRDVLNIFTGEMGPVVFIVEDLHWANPSCLEFFKFWLANEPDAKYMVVGTYHQDDATSTSDLSHFILNMSESDTRFIQLRLEEDPVARAQYLKTLNNQFGKFDEGTKKLLKVAALIGSHFTLDVLDTILCGMDRMKDIDIFTRVEFDPTISSSIQKSLHDKCIPSGVLELVGSRYQFVNDATFDLALQLLQEDPNNKPEIVFKVGKMLYHMSPDDPSLLLAAVNNLNAVLDVLPPDNRYQMARLNREAALQAARMVAFSAAADYLQQGLDLLGDAKWTQDYHQSFEMTKTLAEMALAARSYIGCKIAIDECVLNAQSFGDKLPVYYTLVASLRAQDRCDEAIEVGIQLLQIMGEKVKLSGFRLSAMTSKLRIQFNKVNVANFIDAPVMADLAKLEICKLLHRLSKIALISCNYPLALQLQCRIVQIALKYGPSQFSALGFAALAFGLRVNDNVDDAHKCGQLALELSQKFPDAMAESMVYYFVSHWKQPFSNGLADLEDSHKESLDCGSMGGSMFAAAFHASLSLSSGAGLRALSLLYKDLKEKMAGFSETHTLMKILPEYQFVLNMTGGGRDVVVLTGEAMTEDDFVADCNEMNFSVAILILNVQKMKLAYYFGNYEKGYELRQLIAKQEPKQFTPRATTTVVTALGGLLAAEMYKSSMRKKYLAEAKKELVKLQKWRKVGCGNAKHYAYLLEAEIAGIGGSSSAKQLYRQAIEAAVELGYPHDRALMNERAGVHALSDNDTASACEYMVEATRMYNRWEASAKVAQIKSKYPYLFYDHNSAVSSIHTKKRPDGMDGGPNLRFPAARLPTLQQNTTSSSGGFSSSAGSGPPSGTEYTRRGNNFSRSGGGGMFNRRRFPEDKGSRDKGW